MLIRAKRAAETRIRRVIVALAITGTQAGLFLTVAHGTASLHVEQNDKAIVVLEGKREILEYRYVESPHKPYVARLYTPSGVQVLRDSPSDHQHHHALMFAVAVDTVDFWAEGEETGRETNRSLALVEARLKDGLESAGLSQSLEWTGGPERDVLLLEKRAVMAYQGPTLGATLLTWQSRLQTPLGRKSSLLTGEHYFGLGLRFVESMDRGGHFLNAEGSAGESVRGSERLTPAKWCAYIATADGHPVTVAVFDHPSNPRHPARMFTMTPPFAYIAATLNLWKEPMTLNAGEVLELNYGIALWDGEAQPAEIERVYRLWVQTVPGEASR